MASEREPGFYWVLEKPPLAEWTIAEWDGKFWWDIGMEDRFSEAIWAEIGARVVREYHGEFIDAAANAVYWLQQAERTTQDPEVASKFDSDFVSKLREAHKRLLAAIMSHTVGQREVTDAK